MIRHELVSEELPLNEPEEQKPGQEPDPGPQTPRSRDSKNNVDLAHDEAGKTMNSFLRQAGNLESLANEDMEPLLQMKNKSAFKHVDIKNSERISQQTKVPLINCVYHKWINDTYIDNEDEYLNVYKRAKFKNS